MILVDTSVWIEHLRSGSQGLRGLLYESKVLGHPFVTGELTCGSLKNRGELLALLRALPQAPMGDTEEVLRLIEEERLFSRGIGWVDAHLLASARLARARIWTLDGRLGAVAKLLRVMA